MATDRQINYGKSLLIKNGKNARDFPLDKDTPIKAASFLIDTLKTGSEDQIKNFTPEVHEGKIREFKAEAASKAEQGEGTQGASQPSSSENRAGGYDKSVFDLPLRRISSETIRRFATAMVDLIPDYFYHVPASSTGKYHPSFAQGDGGLVRHTLAALQVCEDIIQNASLMADMPQAAGDMMRAALIIHDGWKFGLIKGVHTCFRHPLLPAEVYSKNVLGTLEFSPAQEKVIGEILLGIESHMGPWNTSSYEKTELPVPLTNLQVMVHLCDYMASKKYLTLQSE